MNKSTLFILVTAVVAGLAGFAASRWLAESNRQQVEATRLDQHLVGSSVPDIELPGLDGSLHRLSDYSGKALLINFWATWCGPCRKEIPDLIAIHEAVAESGGLVLGIALDETEPVRSYSEEMQINYPVWIASGIEGTRMAQRFGNPHGLMPFSIFVDPNGMITDIQLGVVEHEEGLNQLKSLLAQQ